MTVDEVKKARQRIRDYLAQSYHEDRDSDFAKDALDGWYRSLASIELWRAKAEGLAKERDKLCEDKIKKDIREKYVTADNVKLRAENGLLLVVAEAAYDLNPGVASPSGVGPTLLVSADKIIALAAALKALPAKVKP